VNYQEKERKKGGAREARDREKKIEIFPSFLTFFDLGNPRKEKNQKSSSSHPRTIESSTSRTLFPAKTAGIALSLRLTDRSRVLWSGMMKVRPT
jgi:hypothetical protein